VNDAFELLDPRSAEAFLKSFDPETRRRGNSHFQKGHVQGLEPVEGGACYTASVQSGEVSHEVDLEYDPIAGWAGSCDCSREVDCEHIFAAMRALLAEHSAASVRSLTSISPEASAAVARAATKSDDDSGRLARQLMASLGRPLKAEENKFTRKVQNVFKRCQQNRHITRWDFDEMGLHLGGYGWDSLQIWPAFPNDEHDFWLYVANAAKQHNVKIPAFMEPISDLSAIQERLAQWQRAREIEKWKQALGNIHPSASSPPATDTEIDLRVVIAETEALLEWRRGGQENFQPLKSANVQQLTNDSQEGRIHFTSEAELLWHFFSQRIFFTSSAHLRYSDSESVNVIRRFLRVPNLESRIVSRDGQPLVRPTEPLKWELTPAANEDEDYRLRLVQSDGSALPPILCILPGSPSLYLTANAVFKGPNPQEQVLDPLQENRIPAPAIERASGLAFLQSLDLELPPRIRERVRKLPFQVVISCRLQPIYAGSESEDCVVNVLGEAPDGHQQNWTGYNWLDTTRKLGRKPSRDSDAIAVYDWSLLNQIPPLLEPLSLKPSAYGGGLVTRVTKRFPEAFAAWLKTIPPEIQVQLAGDLASFTNADVAGRVKLDVTEAEIDWFDLRVVLNVSDTTLSAEEIKLLLNARGGYVRLAGKGWRRLQYDLSEDEDERLARLGLSPRELSAEPQRLHALQLADEAAKKFLPEQQVEQIHRRASELKARVAPDLPSRVTAELRPYQVEGFHFLAYLSTNRFGGILADDMGLGKTLQTLSWLLWLREHGSSSSSTARDEKKEEKAENQLTTTNHQLPSLVVCPKSVMDNWRVEAERFTSGLRVKVWPPSELEGFHKQLNEADLHVVNYSQLRILGESLAPIRWQAVILDEGQYIKNPNSQTAQVARSLRAQHRLVLSGTPIENRLMDLWSLMAFAMPGVLGSRNQFGKIYDAKGDPFARKRLSSRVRPFLLRRTKAQVAKDLPDRVEEDLYCEIEGEQKTLYRAELKRAQQLLLGIKTQKELAKQQFHFLTSLLRLRQICCHPRLVNPQTQLDGAKAEALLEQLEPLMEEGHKVLVFSQFVELLDLLKPLLEARDWPLFYLAGETENRGKLVERFQSAEGAAVFLISLKAGGFGLNLTAASYVVLFDPWWNPAVENQAIDRTHRIGQTNKVMAYRLLIKNSIEEKIRELQKQKKALAEDVLGEAKFAQSLTLQDLQFLLAD
jgi:SNF2-related domain/Helicase conserved C-terminal domain